ncbi:unnamed protein product (macronuclear) [Paramecium tetraurelia]|uniref:Uncharacterized protein n=1 Tax=Paramecium tetraurelia TaxID=5888 RepID=A0C3N4_PARTE|nr:uncharacterized protein GSPATT00034880001 [Paramecium tetraurelia]CAK65401.1 unnamed protein product [Paramecium tetraurelia]|eukprot:XP_001432798.1 hypothetical protein (macronuclear) [Paramecium tetraurelia strain d4-2]
MIIFALITLVLAQNETLVIKYPQDLAQRPELDKIKFNIANFGFVPYGQRIAGVLEVAQPFNFCQPNFNTTSTYNSDYSNVKVLLVQRGNCTFYTKTINAQSFGYQMLVIVDDMDEEITGLNLVSLNETKEIDIPAIMISKKQGDIIKQYMDAITSDRVYIVVKFPEMIKTDKVNYHYWFSAMDKSSYQFLEQFYPFHMEMKDQLQFTPHYAIDRCGICKKNNYNTRNQQCLSGGRYCASDPDADGPLTGQDAVREIVRQLCIFKQDQSKWWRYVVRYSDICLTQMQAKQCSIEVMKKLNINPETIQSCYDKSFSAGDDELDDNTLLSEQHQINLNYSATSWPILYINDLKYKGSLTVSTYSYNYETGAQQLIDTSHFGPLQTICRSFKEESLPSVCKQRMIGYIDDGVWVEHSQSSSTWVIWVVVLTTMLLLMICTTFLYKRMFRKEANEQINQQVNIHLAQYYALNEQEKSMRK